MNQDTIKERLVKELELKNPKLTKIEIDKIITSHSYNDIIDLYELDTVRVCSECGKLMCEGYCIEGGMEYYCSDECLHKNISEQDYLLLYDNGNGDTYWTEW